MSCQCHSHHEDIEEFEDEEFVLFTGDFVPSFQANSYNPATKKIESYEFSQGKWTVLYFYPADFTFV